MKFDLNWFTTIPGLLITGGVVLLIVALIIFIVTSRSSKKDAKGDEKKDGAVASNDVVDSDQVTGVSQVSTANNVASAVSSTNVSAPVVDPVSTLQNIQPSVEGAQQSNVSDNSSINTALNNVTLNSAPVQNTTSVVDTSAPAPFVAPVVNDNYSNNILQDVKTVSSEVINPASVDPTVDSLNVSSSENVNSVIPTTTVDVPVVSDVIEDINIPTPSIDVLTPSNSSVNNSVNVEPITNSVNNEHAIYGGVSQIIPNMDLGTNTTNNHQIYGGADPLENTQSIKIQDLNNSSTPSVSEIPSVVDVSNDVSVIPDVSTPSIPSVEVIGDENGGVSNTPVPSALSPEIPVIPAAEVSPLMPNDTNNI